MNKKSISTSLIIALLLFSQTCLAYIYSFTGYDETGKIVSGELTALGFVDAKVQGFVYKDKNEQIYFTGKWVGKGEVEGYDDNGYFLEIKAHPIGIGEDSFDIHINACKQLVNYLENALKADICDYAGFRGRINLAIDHIKAFFGNVELRQKLYLYQSVLLDAPMAATNFRIIFENPDRSYSKERIMGMLGLDSFFYDTSLAKNVIKWNIRFLNDSIKNYEQFKSSGFKF